MSHERCLDAAADEVSGVPIEPRIGAVRVAGGARLNEAAPCAEILTPLGKAQRSRDGEKLLFLFSPTGGDLHLHRELRDIVRQTYWSASGSVTAALRRSIAIANRYLFEHNLNTDRSDRCYGGLACAVLRGRDLFLLQAGPVWACVVQKQQLRCFPRGEKLAHMGIGPSPDVRLYHIFAAEGDTLLLAPHTLLREANEDGLRRALSYDDVHSMTAGLEQIGGEDFVALVARWAPAPPRRPPQVQALPRAKRAESSTRRAVEAVHRPKTRKQGGRESHTTGQQIPEQERRIEERSPTRERRKRPMKANRALGRALKNSWNYLSSTLGYVWHGFAAAGAGIAALGKWLLGAMAMTIRSLLPGSERTIPRRTRQQPPPQENRVAMMVVAAAIPIVMLAVVLVAYRGFAAESRLQGILRHAEEQIALAQAAEPDSEEARAHWERALEQVEAATTLQPEEPSIQALREQVRQALDRFDRIERVTLTRLADFGSSNTGRRLVVHNQMLFVVDPQDGWVARVPIQSTGAEEGETAQDRPPVLMHTGQQINGEDIGPLVDATWVDADEGRQNSALLVLAEGDQLVSYDPAWRSESGAPQLSLPKLNAAPMERPVAVGSYRGRFYVLDATAENGGQIWRYMPQRNVYSNQPERYFATSPPRSLEQAFDMAIDGDIYILYQDGQVEKFRGGEIQPFDIGGVPGGLGEVSGFAVDPNGDGTVYVADRGNDRIVVLSPDGRFQSQLRAEPPLTFLEALSVSQADERLYVLAAGQVYAGTLP